jgi:DNA-binding MarR family transcriptional regulator
MPRLARRLLGADRDPAAELPLAQLRVCGILAADARRPMSALSRDLGVSLSAMTQIADRLERAQLVQRVAEGTDRRVRCLELTPRGEKMMRRREKARVQRVQSVLEHLSPRVRSDVRAALETLLVACDVSRERSAVAALPPSEQLAPCTATLTPGPEP